MLLTNVIWVNGWVYNRFFEDGVLIAEIMVRDNCPLMINDIVSDFRRAQNMAARYGTFPKDSYGEDLYVREISKGGSQEKLL